MSFCFSKDDEPTMNLKADTTEFSTPINNNNAAKSESKTDAAVSSSTSSDVEEEKSEAKLQSGLEKDYENEEVKEVEKPTEMIANSSIDELLGQLEKSDSAIEDNMSPEE